MDRGALSPMSRGHSRTPVSAHIITHAHISTMTHPTGTNRVAHAYETLDNHRTLMWLDSGASCSVASISCIPDMHIEPAHVTKLLNADGRDITPCRVATMTVELGQFLTSHKFVVVDHLSTSVINPWL